MLYRYKELYQSADGSAGQCMGKVSFHSGENAEVLKDIFDIKWRSSCRFTKAADKRACETDLLAEAFKKCIQ